MCAGVYVHLGCYVLCVHVRVHVHRIERWMASSCWLVRCRIHVHVFSKLIDSWLRCQASGATTGVAVFTNRSSVTALTIVTSATAETRVIVQVLLIRMVLPHIHRYVHVALVYIYVHVLVQSCTPTVFKYKRTCTFAYTRGNIHVLMIIQFVFQFCSFQFKFV